MDDSEFVIVYSTFPDDATARQAAEALVQAKLAACVNIQAPMLSLYEWEGRLEAARETGVFVKTRRALADAAIETARKLHPYSVPCFVILPVTGGDADYLSWIRSQTVQAHK